MHYKYTMTDPAVEPATYHYQKPLPVGYEPIRYHYNHSYWYNWINQPEDTLNSHSIAPNFKVKLKDRHLHIRHKGNVHHVPLSEIVNVQLTFKRLLLPIITGGIVAPLSFISLYSAVLDQWIAVGLLFTGMMLAYYGYTGAYQLQVFLKNQVTLSFFVDEKTLPLTRFVDVVRAALLKSAMRLY